MLRKPFVYIVPATCGVATVEMTRRAKVFESPSLDTYADRYGLVNWAMTHAQLSSTGKHCYDSNLERSIRFGQHDLVDRLTMDGKVSELNVDAALRIAVKHNNVAAVSLLLLRGSTLIDIDSVVDNHTLLSLAIQNGNSEIVEVLLRFGADPNFPYIAADRYATTGRYATSCLLWLAHNCTASDPKIISLLLEHGAAIDVFDNNGTPLLHECIRFGFDNSTNLLLDKGANVNILDEWGFNALHVICYWNIKNEELIEKLVKHGIQVDAVDRYGRTAWDIAVKAEHYELCEILHKHGAMIFLSR